MKILERALVIIFLILTILYVPSTVFAASNNETIIREAQEIQNNFESVTIFNELNILPLAFGQDTFTFTGAWRSQRIQLTRTAGSSGITVTAFNYGNNYIDICIFKRGSSSELVGYTKTILPNQETLLSWTNNELISNPNEIDIFMSMYRTVQNNLTITVTY